MFFFYTEIHTKKFKTLFETLVSAFIPQIDI